MLKKQVSIATDGACKGTPGPGGWSAVIWNEKRKKVIFGYEAETTNNKMELMGAIRALEHLKEPCKVTLITDSKYLHDGITIWIHNWLRKDFKDVKNTDLWIRLAEATIRHEISWKLVKGHNGHKENEEADNYANFAVKEQREGEIIMENY